jgi:hypothetical protein
VSDIEPTSVTRTRTAHKHTRARARAGRMLRLGCARSISCGLRAFVPPQECAKFGAVDRVVIPRPPKSAFFLLHGRTNRTFVSLALPPLPPLQGLHRVVLSDSTALRMDGTGPPKLGVGTADSRLPLSDAQGCSVIRAPSARLRTSVCTGMLLGPYGCVTSESAYSNSNQDCDVVRESVRPVLVGGGRQQGAARHPWAAFRKQRESTPPSRHRCVRICEQRRNQTQFGLSPDPPSCGFPLRPPRVPLLSPVRHCRLLLYVAFIFAALF